MQAEPRTTSYDLRTLTGNCVDQGSIQLDTRRFAGIFPFDISEIDCIDCNDATQEECNYNYHSRSQLLSKHTSISQVRVSSVENIDERPLGEDSCCRAGSDYATEYGWTEIDEDLAQIPDDPCSIRTIAPSADTQSAMDMTWRPKPKIHMCLTDQMGLIQARSQAIEMMHGAGLNPASKIRCRRQGCADVLPGVEALKYHLHIHNIAAEAAECNDIPFSPCETLLHHVCDLMSSKKGHSRTKSSPGAQHTHSVTHLSSRNISAGSLLPPHLFPRQIFSEGQPKFLVSDHTPGNSTNPIPPCNKNEGFCTAGSISSRRVGSSVAAGDPALAITLSPPSSLDMHDHFMFAPHENLPVPPELNPAAVGENDHRVIALSENAPNAPEKLTRLRGPMKALSPTRALSPIRNGIRRVLSIGYSADSSE